MVRRRGFSLLEVTAAGILLAMMLTVSLQFFRATAAQRRGLQARRTAIQEVANVMERLSARPWEELTAENVAEIEHSPEAQQAIPGSELKIDVLQTEGEPEGKRITVVLRWPAGASQPDRSVRLVAWRYRNGND
ncbi:MAG: type II secretion system protein [Planctomycetota bacterium]